ncbi:MAG: PEP-CTERM sorting domain-containing protein [Akkermansiaceae bacterium]
MKAHTIILFGSLACVSANAALLADFDGNDAAYQTGFVRSDPGAAALVVNDGSFRVLNSANGDNGNYISFDATGTAGWQTASFSMDIFASAVQADGFGVNFIDTATHGNSGVVRAGTGVGNDAEERGRISNSIGVGFRTFNGTNATVNYNGEDSSDVVYNLPRDTFVPLTIDMTRNGDGTVNLSAAVNGETVFENYSLSGGPDDFRVQIMGRTGGSAMTLDIDNVNLTTAIPEPTSTLMSALGFLVLAARRKR